MNRRTARNIRWTATAVWAAFVAWLWTLEHSAVLAHLNATLDPREKSAILAAAFTPQKFFWMRLGATAAMVLPWMLPAPSLRYPFELVAKTQETWRGLSPAQRTLFAGLMVVWAVRNAVFVSLFPITMDEANVYTTFVRRGPALIACYYPIPSNHVFHTMTVWATDVFLDGVWAVRLTAWAATGATGAVLFLWTARRSGAKAAFLTAGTFLFSFGPTLYGVLGRGYAFLAFFSLLVFYAETTNRKTLSVTAAALGLWTAPVFVYVVAAAALVFRRPWRMVVAVACAAALYMPIFIAGGNLTGFYPPSTLAQQLAHLPDYLPYVAEFLSPLRLPPEYRWASVATFGTWAGAVLLAAFARGSGVWERSAARFSLVILALMLLPVVQPPDKAYIVWTAPAALALARFRQWRCFAPALWAAASVAFVPVFRYWYAPDIAAYEKFKSMTQTSVYVADNDAEYLTFSFYAPKGTTVVFNPKNPQPSL